MVDEELLKRQTAHTNRWYGLLVTVIASGSVGSVLERSNPILGGMYLAI